MELAKVTSNGQITIPTSIRRRLCLKDGDKVLFLEGDDGVLMLNSSIIALKQIQSDMKNEASKAGLFTEEDVVALCREVRNELSGLRNANHD